MKTKIQMISRICNYINFISIVIALTELFIFTISVINKISKFTFTKELVPLIIMISPLIVILIIFSLLIIALIHIHILLTVIPCVVSVRLNKEAKNITDNILFTKIYRRDAMCKIFFHFILMILLDFHGVGIIRGLLFVNYIVLLGLDIVEIIMIKKFKEISKTNE